MSVIKRYVDYLFYILIVILSVFTISPLFHSGFFPIHDDAQVARVFEMHKSLADGMFPVRWVADLGYGYGYPIFNFYAPLAYYVGSFFNFIGFSALNSTKMMMGFGSILAGLCMYLFAKEVWGKAGGVISAVLYLYAPYHAVDMYVRGDIAESYAYAFIPLAFYGIYKNYSYYSNSLSSDNGKKNAEQKWNRLPILGIFVSAVGYAGIILSHNLTAMMVTPFLFLFAAVLFVYSCFQKQQRKHYYLFAGLLIGILLSAFYWLPALTEMKYTNVGSVITGGSQYKDHFVCLQELWSSQWGYGGSIPGCYDGLSLEIGKINVILAVLSVIPLFYFFLSKRNTMRKILLVYSLLSFALTVFLMIQQSKFIWDAISYMAYFQFPWRFLVMASFFTSFLAGSVFCMTTLILNNKRLLQISYFIFLGIICIAIVFFSKKYFVPQKYLAIKSSDFTNSSTLKWSTSKVSDEYLPKGFHIPKNTIQIPTKLFTSTKMPFKLNDVNTSTQKIHVVITTAKRNQVHVNLAYFPAWHAFIDENETGFTVTKTGINITIPKGKHMVAFLFKQTNVEKISDSISVTGVIILLLGIIYPLIKRYEYKKTNS